MRLVDLKIRRRPELISGIKINEGNQWVLINYNPIDYVLDGFSFISKKYLTKVFNVSEDDFDYKVLLKKYDEKISGLFSDMIMETYISLLSSLLKKSKLIEFEFESSGYCIIGKIVKINKKSFTINKLSTEGQFLGEERYNVESIRIINIDTDYLKALDGYMASLGNVSN